MKRPRLAVLWVSALLALTSCGSTVAVGDRAALSGRMSSGEGGAALPGEAGFSGDLDDGLTGGDSDRVGDGAQPGLPNGPGSGQARSGVVGASRGSGGAGTPGTSVPAGPTTSGPIQIGVLVTDTDSFKAASGSGESFTLLTRTATNAHIKAINDAGGIAGRKLSVVEATFNYTAASYENEFEAACQKFTRDNRVSAVIYDGITYNPTFNTCLTNAGVPAFYMQQVGTAVGDDTDMKAYPGLVTAGSVSMDRRLRTMLEGGLTQGFVKRGNKIGVLVEACPYHVRAFERTLLPLAARNGITMLRTDIECGAGSADHGTGIAAAQSAVLRYNSEGVDTVMFVTNYENGVVFYFGAQAESQQYRPQYLLWHNQGCPVCKAFWEDQGFQAQLVKMRGFGGTPLWDVTSPPAPPPAQAAVREACLSTAKRYGVSTASFNHQAIVLDTCDAVSLLRRALSLSGGQGGTPAIRAAVERLGTDFVSTMTLGGATRFGPGVHDGLAMGAVSVYDLKCECFTYITSPRPIR